MRKVVIFLCLSFSFCLSKSFVNDIFEYAELAASYNDVDILVSSDIEAKNYVFYTSKPYPKITLEVFEKSLKLQGLKLAYTGNFYYVYEDKKDNNQTFSGANFENSLLSKDKALRYIKLENNSFDDVKNLLSLYDINATYLYRSNAVTFLSDDFIYDKLRSSIDDLDKSELKQLRFKITILETNLDDLKDMGSKLNSLLKGVSIPNFNLFVNLITIPYNSQNNVIGNDKEGFYSTLSFLQNKGITKIVSNPFLLARSNTEVFFSSVQNIPFLKAVTSVSNTEVSQSSSYEYKDVGLQLWLKPVIIGDKVDLSLHLIVEDLLSNTNLTPVTSKKELKSSYTLKKGELLVLSGINKVTNTNYTSGIPLLQDIWLLGYLFKIERSQTTNTVLALSIEIL